MDVFPFALFHVISWFLVLAFYDITHAAFLVTVDPQIDHTSYPHDREGGGLIVCPIISTQRTLFSAKFEMVFTHDPFAV